MSRTRTNPNELIERGVINMLDYVDTQSFTPQFPVIQPEVQSILDLSDIQQQEENLLVADAQKRGQARDELYKILQRDPACEGMTTQPTEGLLSLMEKYVFTKEYYDHISITEERKSYLRNRVALLTGKLKQKSIKFPDVMASIIRFHAAKISIRTAKVTSEIGINLDSIDEELFSSSGEGKEEVKAKLSIANAETLFPELQASFPDLHAKLKSYYDNPVKETMSGKVVPSLLEIAGAMRRMIEQEIYNRAQLESDAEAAFREYKERKNYAENPDQPKTDKYKNLEQNKEYQRKKHEELRLMTHKILAPVFTLKNYNGRFTYTTNPPTGSGLSPVSYNESIIASPLATPPTPSVHDRLRTMIEPAIKEFQDDVVDRYYQELFGMSKTEAEEQKKEELRTAMKKDALRGGVESKYIQTITEAERLIKEACGKEVSLHPGAWFSIEYPVSAQKQGKSLITIDKVDDSGYVHFKHISNPMSLKELSQYIINPNYGKDPNVNTQMNIEFLYDGNKKPIKNCMQLEAKLGLRKSKDFTSAQKIHPGQHIVRYDAVNQKNVLCGKVGRVEKEGIVFKNIDGKEEFMEFAKFYLTLQLEGWTINTQKDSYDEIEKLEPMHGPQIIFASVGSLSASAIATVKELFQPLWDKLEVADLEDKVKGALPIGSDVWKAMNAKLMEKETKAVGEEVKKIKDKYKKGGEKRTGLLEFMKSPPDIRTFSGRVQSKAWLQVTLSTFGTLYPSPKLDVYEKNRFWLRLFGFSGVAKDPTKGTIYQEALINATGATNSTDARVEIMTLMTMVEMGKYTHPCMAGSMGKSFRGEIQTWTDTGEKECLDGKLKNINGASVPEIYKIVSESIDNQEYTLKELFGKLAAKGYGAKEMFNLFLYAVDRLHLSETGKHQFKITTKQLSAIGKELAGKYPMPFFAAMAKEENYVNFCNFIYNNSYVRDVIGWKAGAWKGKTVGDFTFKEPAAGADALYKFFMAREGDYNILRGISSDYKKSIGESFEYAEGEQDFAQYRNMLSGLYSNYTSLSANSAEIDKQNWTHMPLLTLDDKYFSAVCGGGAPLTKGDWSTAEASLYFEKLLSEYQLASSSMTLPLNDRLELQRRVGKFIWEHFWDKFNFKEDPNAAGRQEGRLAADSNRSFFIEKYGDKLSSLGFSHYQLGKTFGGDGIKSFVYLSDNKPIIPNARNYDQGGVDNTEEYRKKSDNKIIQFRRPPRLPDDIAA